MAGNQKQASVDLTLQEITQIEQVLLRHKRSHLVQALQEKMRNARESLVKDSDE